MKSTESTLAALFDLQAQIEAEAARVLRDSQAVKQVLKRQPLSPELPDLLAELRRSADTLKTLATRCRSALTDHADAEFLAEQATRPKWRPSRNPSPGERAKRAMAKRGCQVMPL